LSVESPSQRHRVIGAVLLALLAGGCTEIDNPVNTEIGTTRVITVDSGLAPQSVTDPQAPIQVAEWTIEVAELEYSGLDEPLDLTIGSTCELVQTVYEFPITEGRCERGMIIDSAAAGPREVLLRLAFTMQVRRAEPVDFDDPANRPPDYDVDGIRNEIDNCPLVYNPEQRDDDLNGIPDACQVSDGFGGALLDSDADRVPDSFDNCVWKPNPGQENTSGLAADNINDGIGDACEEQVAVVEAPPGETHITYFLEYPLGGELSQPRGGLTYITMDFPDPSALSCNWEEGRCLLDPDQALFCVNTSLVEAGLIGCDK
jgi:hypothetical protein